MSEDKEEGEETYPLEVPGSVFRRYADRAVNYKLGQLSEGYNAIKGQIEHNETEAQKQWGQLHEEIADLSDTIDERLKKLEQAYQRVVGWMAGISASTAVIIWFAEHFLLK